MRASLPVLLILLALGIPSAAAGQNGLTVPAGFAIDTIAKAERPRELAFSPNGDLFAGSLSGDVYVIPHAERSPGEAKVFVHVDDAPVAGVFFAGNTLYLGSQHAVWRVAYRSGDERATAPPEKIAAIRPGNGDGHITTSLSLAGDRLYAGVGSSCDACTESDPTRATIEMMDRDGRGMRPKAVHVRNAIALALNPATGSVWAGVAGQDQLEHGHPYEIFDPFTLHAGTPEYGWPSCYDNRRPVRPGTACNGMATGRVVFPAYETPIGAVFYPQAQRGKYVFPSEYRGGAFVTLHGSWHFPLVPPRVVYIPIKGDVPETAVNWNDPGAQWSEFVGGFQNGMGYRSGRPTGIAVGPQGSLFVADDQTGAVYRIRPR